MLDRGPLRLTVPKRHWTRRLRPEHDLADRLPDQVRNAAAGSRGGLAQPFELFLGQIDLSLFHVRQFEVTDDIRQSPAAQTATDFMPELATNSCCTNARAGARRRSVSVIRHFSPRTIIAARRNLHSCQSRPAHAAMERGMT